MTGVDLRDPLAIHFYERALDGQPVRVRLEDGTDAPLAAQVWNTSRPGDDSVLARCRSATLDVGCGSGRLTEALTAVGVRALGVDISPQAVLLTRSRGADAVCQDIFARSPRLGRWQHVLLMDGNIGIAGDAGALLGRCRELLGRDGTVIVEAGQPGSGIRQLVVQLVHADRPSRPFRWLVSDGNGIKAMGAAVGLVPSAEWSAGGRWFVELCATGGSSHARAQQ